MIPQQDSASFQHKLARTFAQVETLKRYRGGGGAVPAPINRAEALRSIAASDTAGSSPGTKADSDRGRLTESATIGFLKN